MSRNSRGKEKECSFIRISVERRYIEVSSISTCFSGARDLANRAIFQGAFPKKARILSEG